MFRIKRLREGVTLCVENKDEITVISFLVPLWYLSKFTDPGICLGTFFVLHIYTFVSDKKPVGSRQGVCLFTSVKTVFL